MWKPREHFAVYCQASGCRFASLLLPSLAIAEQKAQQHTKAEGHRAMITHTTERAVAPRPIASPISSARSRGWKKRSLCSSSS